MASEYDYQHGNLLPHSSDRDNCKVGVLRTLHWPHNTHVGQSTFTTIRHQKSLDLDLINKRRILAFGIDGWFLSSEDLPWSNLLYTQKVKDSHYGL